MTLFSHLYPYLLYIKQPTIVHKIVMFYVTLKILVKIVPQKIENMVKLNKKVCFTDKGSRRLSTVIADFAERIRIKLHHFRLENKQLKEFMKLFWNGQQNYLNTLSTKGVRYHPMITRYCLSLVVKSPAVYDELRYDEKNNSGVLILPSGRRLRDYKNYIRPERGFNPFIIKELIDKVKEFSEIEKFMILLMDEMKIQVKPGMG